MIATDHLIRARPFHCHNNQQFVAHIYQCVYRPATALDTDAGAISPFCLFWMRIEKELAHFDLIVGNSTSLVAETKPILIWLERQHQLF